ncbi:CoA transferase [Nocardiopsis listeri]|uniref:CoA transferase n=1 Tax=Nocardiopsis listeri TaxID=53440 RepID=UPI0008353144
MVDETTLRAWTAIAGTAEPPAEIVRHTAGNILPAVLPVRALATATVGACSLAAAELLAARNGGVVPRVHVDEGAVATAFVSERHLRVDGREPTPFAPLSGFWRASDGWVRTHANYPHHRERLLHALDIDAKDDPDTLPDRLAAVLSGLAATEIQERVYAAGGLAVAVAPAPDRGTSAIGRAPLAEVVPHGEVADRYLEPAALPAAGVRVLDLTRVIAGPVATRTLALLGADVLRVDPPGTPEDPDSHIDTGPGKRSALVDLDSAEGRGVLEGLLDTADVVVTGYRPGSLGRRGMAAADLVARRPGLVVAGLRAWDRSGPWSGRRGFDSLVQAATGIAAIESGQDGRPGALPAQALDHGTGYLMAAGVLRALTDRLSDGRGRRLGFSLAGTASWLLHDIVAQEPGAGTHDAEEWLVEAPSPYGRLRYALPPVRYEGGPRDWARTASRWGADPAIWL